MLQGMEVTSKLGKFITLDQFYDRLQYCIYRTAKSQAQAEFVETHSQLNAVPPRIYGSHATVSSTLQKTTDFRVEKYYHTAGPTE
jgi:hypothetical protein